MFKKKLFLAILGFVFIFGILAIDTAIAQEANPTPTTDYTTKCDIKFIPNVSIPGSGFDKNIQEGVCINSDSLGYYIVALYKFGAGFAGIVAMFMLVFAGWQWLMAAGRAEQISKAKDTIVGVFIGLALLFGGYLLMSQISQNSVNFKDLALAPVHVKDTDKMLCRLHADDKASSTIPGDQDNNLPGCGKEYELKSDISPGRELICIDINCGTTDTPSTKSCVIKDTIELCPSVRTLSQANLGCECVETVCDKIEFRGSNKCEDYNDRESCKNNVCYNKADKNGNIMGFICGVDWDDDIGKKCEMIGEVSCGSNADCFFDKDGDGISEYCCDDRTILDDKCEVVTTANCK